MRGNCMLFCDYLCTYKRGLFDFDSDKQRIIRMCVLHFHQIIANHSYEKVSELSALWQEQHQRAMASCYTGFLKPMCCEVIE